ncbi:TAXI family TRAP transporter solute-binding subunit [Effusibacillus dendaii]|uniref:C4-dicarboxylate ABC transporter substrate-binding protein n=1 Tax=Effusibacillus dendaii TaxID=2743772 RepID=A0A7I8DE46_9BACL|nr:TAXI family TRAP transporter solute-binding subunit [Effusibacillus dendaii]BCJ87552.1 C4-dicarboxylate ABC transporter substrate-binding protein [Effusibacillus dendaii]
MKKAFALVTAAALALTAVVGCGSSTPTAKDGAAPTAKTPDRITIATATTGGVYYPVGNALAKLWTTKNNVQAVAQTSAGGVANLQMFAKKEAEIAFVESGIADYAVKGTEMFDGKKIDNIRGLTSLYPNVVHIIVKADSGINSLKDIKGKRIIPGSHGSSSEVNTRKILEAYGLDYVKRQDVKADFIGFNESAEALKNGQVDLISMTGGTPLAATLDVASSIPVKLLSIDKDMIDKLVKDNPYFVPYTIPKGTYKGQDEDVNTVAVTNLLVVRADLPTDFVYNLTKTMFENLPTLIETHKALKDLTKDNALTGMNVPLHEGSKKYFKEIGLNVDGK